MRKKRKQTKKLDRIEKLLVDYRLYHFIYGYLNNKMDSEDVLQDTLFALFKNNTFEEKEASFKTYAYTIAKNKSLNALKQRQKNTTLSLDYLLQQGYDFPEKTQTKQQYPALIYAIKDLNGVYQKVVWLRYFEGHTPTQIAKRLQCSKKKVYNILHRAKSKLRRKLQQNRSTF